MITEPISVYINWASYDELSDHIELTEALAMQQLDELLRLRSLGVRFDYYLMDAFWYAPDGGYRTWRQPHWPNGPDRWLKRCLENGVKPGLWVASNVTVGLHVIPEWADATDDDGKLTWKGLCLFHGGYLAHFMETLDHWYRRGVRLFKFDFTNFDAAPRHLAETLLPSEIRAANVTALRGALKVFRQSHPEAILIAYNGFEELPAQSRTDFPLRKVMDNRWLECFDAIYCGDPRPADVPAMNFWRSKDVYSDHMVWYYAANGLPHSRIDNSGFMIGKTGTCYYRQTAAWQGMLILSLARGGFVNTYYGNLELLDADKARWFAQVQALFLPLQRFTRMFGGVPGQGQPYGFAALSGTDGLITVVNPGQTTAALEVPAEGRILFSDAGFTPVLSGQTITLGPEQMALIGVGALAAYDLGVQADVVIPQRVQPVPVELAAEDKALSATLTALPTEGSLRLVLRQRAPNGEAKRSTGGSPPDGRSMGQIYRLQAWQNDREIPVDIQYDKAIWSGLSWAVGEIPVSRLERGVPLTIRLATAENAPVNLSGEIYHVTYKI